MSSLTLVVVKNRGMTACTTSGTESMNILSTGIVVEDAGKDVGHDDDEDNREVPVKVGELTDPMAGVISKGQISIKIPVGILIRSLERSGPLIKRRPITISSPY